MNFETLDNWLPFSEESEQSLLAAILLGGAVGLASAIISPSDVYTPLNAELFEVMQELDESASPIDMTTTIDKVVERGNFDQLETLQYLVELSGAFARTENIEAYAKTIKNFSCERQVIRVAGEMVSAIKHGDGTSEERVNNAMGLFNAINVDTYEQKDFKAQVQEFHAEMERRSELKTEVTGLSTGFHELDRVTAGLQDTDLIYLGARPGQGKTTMGINIASHMAKKLGKGEGVVMVFSMEMPASQLIGRMHAAEGGVKMNSIKSPALYMEKGGCSGWGGFNAGAHKVASMAGNIVIDDRPNLSPQEIRAACLAAERKYGSVKFVMVDYVQIMKYQGLSNPIERIGACSNALKALAVEMQCPVLSLAQLNREIEKRADKRPVNSDLKGSGALEQDADMIWFIHSDDESDQQDISAGSGDGFASLIISKFRSGEPQDILFKKDLSTSRFLNHGSA